MKYDIDIFDIPVNPHDYRFDRLKNAKLLNIVFAPGCFGNFLRYFVERFSAKTPDMEQNPFTELGTSHKIQTKDFCGLVQRYHQTFINDNQGETELPVCLITPSTKKHYLYLKKAHWFRAGDSMNSPDDLWKKAVGEMKGGVKEAAESIIKLYGIKEPAHFSWLPKFIVRDWYKLEFLERLEDTYNYHWFKKFQTHEFFKKQKTFILNLETFFKWEIFIENMIELDAVFDLDLDFNRQLEMKQIFDRGLGLDQIRLECNLAQDVLEKETDHQLGNLDVATEAYIYAHYERQFPDIQMPLTNRFFRDTEEIKQFLGHFPNWYRRPNPNLGQKSSISSDF
jgi:hypothetical protein